jgi:hypothetical protein
MLGVLSSRRRDGLRYAVVNDHVLEAAEIIIVLG